MDKRPSFSKIKRVPCPHCGNLCSTKAKECQKCGEPLDSVSEPQKASLSFLKDDFDERDYLDLLEAQIGKSIPKREVTTGNEIGYKEQNGQVIEISIPYCRLKSLPPLLTELTALKALFLSHNQFHVFPKQIIHFKSLECLYLDHNQIDVIQNQYLSKLTSLITLNLDSNCLEKLPNGIGSLRSLKQLSLRRNQLIELPKTIGFLKNLKKLNLRINNLENLPVSIGNLKNLRWLNISSNKLKNLPESMGQLVLLEYLNISNNKLTKIPKSFENLHSLKDLNIKANFWISLPESVEGLQNFGLKIKR